MTRINPHLPDSALYGLRRRRRRFFALPVLLFLVVLFIIYAWKVTR